MNERNEIASGKDNCYMKSILKFFSPEFLYRGLRSFIATHHTTQSSQRFGIRFSSHAPRLIIHRSPSSKFILKGILYILTYEGGIDPVYISLGKNSNLVIDGDFWIGNGVSIVLADNAELYIGGRRKESASGITERTKIMVNKRIKIGTDCIIGWNVYITDCDWHKIEGISYQKNTTIGDHVWICSNSSILKGTNIANNCIIAAHSVIRGLHTRDGSLIGGNPAQIIASNVKWTRDMSQQL